MLAYVTLGTNNIEKSLAFYEPFMAEFGAKKLFDNGRLHFFGTGMDAPMIAVGGPYDEQTATNGNGTMLAMPVASREDVDRIYAKALELGGTSEGEPGERMPTFYGGYVRDPDNNKICVCKIG